MNSRITYLCCLEPCQPCGKGKTLAHASRSPCAAVKPGLQSARCRHPISCVRTIAPTPTNINCPLRTCSDVECALYVHSPL